MKGTPNRLGKPTLLATNGAIHSEIAELFTEVFNGHHRVPLRQLGPSL
jgi:hypothetical protein